ncbi:MAG: hypothetical protein KAI17_21350 [Thiotrichaceae bacterium]|nr:hypothetical protein [Thiotrichaceae bacterium]
MQDIFDQLTIYLKGVWNKRWSAMIIAWLVCVIGWGVVYKLPDQYESTAKIYIDTNSLLKPLLKGLTVETNVAQEIRLMVKTLLTRPNVEKIIRLSDLDLQVQNDIEFDALVEKLQKEITFEKVSRTKSNLYNLSYRNSSPILAQRVLQSVLTVFVENSIGQSKEDGISARKFINKQIEEYEKRLATAENNLKLFKQENIGNLPSSTGNYYSRMENAKNFLSQAELELRELQRGERALERELSQLRNTLKQANNDNSFLLETSYDVRIETLNAELDEKLLKYTDNHPTIKSLTRVLEDLDAKRLIELKMLQDSAATDGVALNQNPVYQELKIQLGKTNSQISSLQVRVEEYKRRSDELESMVDHIPAVEAQLTALNRDYDITKKKYEQLLERRESATISEHVENTTDSVQFNVLEQPRIANTPVGPKRIVLSSLVLVFGVGLGIGFAFLLSQLKPVFSSTRELEQFAGLPILGSVSAITSPVQRRRRTLLVMTYLSLFFMLLIVYALIVGWYMGLFDKLLALI